MTSLDPEIESTLKRVRQAWRRTRLRRAAGLSLVTALSGWLILAVAAWRDLIVNPLVFTAAAAVLFLTIAAVLLASLLVFFLNGPETAWLADELEEAQPDLEDRVNTLVWLARRGAHLPPDGYRQRIERQARRTLLSNDRLPTWTSSFDRALGAAALLLFVGALVFDGRVHPLQHLHWEPEESAPMGASETRPHLPDPVQSAAEVQKTWGEIRITEPGRDLKVTKVDVVPLQIEAATSADLKDATYVTAAAGAKPDTHRLPAPKEAHYALYKPLLYVDELHLVDWDVLTYYAAAGTASGQRFSSDVYFLEVRPFHEDILKLPGGESGRAYRLLSELTGLINRQKTVIRETHGYDARAYAHAEQKRQDRDRLSSAEGDLAEAARHLYARIAAAMENQDVAVVLDHLAQADRHLERAARALVRDDPVADDAERQALLDLVATRKDLQKTITDHPGDFDDASSDDEPGAVAELEGKLNQISEFRDEEKAVRDALDDLWQRQQHLLDALKAARLDAGRRASLGAEQEKLRQELSELASRHPRPFKRAERERAAADDAMRRAAEALADAKADAVAAGDGALQSLGALRDAVRSSAAGRELEQAYQLKRIIDGSARELTRMEAEPGKAKADAVSRTAEQAKRATRELKRLIDDTPAGDAFGEPLRNALGPARQVDRERRLDAVTRADSEDARKAAAREARRSLEQLSQAFERSEPSVARDLRADDPLHEKNDETFERGLRQLRGLEAAAEQGREEDAENRERQRREILLNLRKGAESRYGKDPKLLRLIAELEDALTKKVDLKVDPQKLRRLLDDIEQFRAESSQPPGAPDDPHLRHFDPSKVPPAYRDRIQKYFEKLAEQP